MSAREQATAVWQTILHYNANSKGGEAEQFSIEAIEKAIEQAEARGAKDWRSWAQFVYLGGGEPTGTDDELRRAVALANDKSIAAAEARGREGCCCGHTEKCVCRDLGRDAGLEPVRKEWAKLSATIAMLTVAEGSQVSAGEINVLKERMDDLLSDEIALKRGGRE